MADLVTPPPYFSPPNPTLVPFSQPLPAYPSSEASEEVCPSANLIPPKLTEAIIDEFVMVPGKEELEKEIDEAIEKSTHIVVSTHQKSQVEESLRSGVAWWTGLNLDEATSGQLAFATGVAVISSASGHVLVPILSHTWLTLPVLMLIPGVNVVTKICILAGVALTPNFLIHGLLGKETVSATLYWTGVGAYSAAEKSCALAKRRCELLMNGKSEMKLLMDGGGKNKLKISE